MEALRWDRRYENVRLPELNIGWSREMENEVDPAEVLGSDDMVVNG